MPKRGFNGRFEGLIGHRAKLAAQFPDPLWTTDQKIGERPEEMKKQDDDDPDHLGIAGRRFMANATDQGRDQQHRAKKQDQEEEHPPCIAPMRESYGEETHFLVVDRCRGAREPNATIEVRVNNRKY